MTPDMRDITVDVKGYSYPAGWNTAKLARHLERLVRDEVRRLVEARDEQG